MIYKSTKKQYLLLSVCYGAATVHGNGANSYHDSNYSTFHRIKNFREI